MLGGCLMKLVLFSIAACAFFWVILVALNPWALHIGGRSTPLLYWHGSGTLVSKDGKSYPLYVSFWPGKPGKHGGGRREGKIWSADLKGTGWLCVAPGSVERMDMSGTMYGGYTSSENSLFRLPVSGVAETVPDQLPQSRLFRCGRRMARAPAGNG